MSLNPTIRTVDLRIAIGEALGFDFRGKVEASNSNSLSAIRFTRGHLDVIGAELGIDVDAQDSRTELLSAIRSELGVDERSSAHLDWGELRRVVGATDIDVSDACRYDLSDGSAGEDPDEEQTGAGDGPWSGWDGGSA